MSSGGPIEGKQEGGPPVADRAAKGQEFPACEPREGHCGSVGAKRQWGSLHQIEISLLFREVRVFIMSDPVNSGKGERLAQILGLSVSSLRPSGPFLGLKYPFAVVLQLSYGFLYIV